VVVAVCARLRRSLIGEAEVTQTSVVVKANAQYIVASKSRFAKLKIAVETTTREKGGCEACYGCG